MQNSRAAITLIEAIQDRTRVTGLTHAYYRYPARFSPRFAGVAIELFSKPGDIVYDPFMGGGTTLVEAMRLRRRGIGTDLNSLAVFISKAKTTILSDSTLDALRRWAIEAQSKLKLTGQGGRPVDWISQSYQKNISGRTTWPIRKTIETALAGLARISHTATTILVQMPSEDPI
jgi:hypothetical protein